MTEAELTFPSKLRGDQYGIEIQILPHWVDHSRKQCRIPEIHDLIKLFAIKNTHLSHSRVSKQKLSTKTF